MIGAASGGQLKTIEWIVDNGLPYDIIDAMEIAKKKEHEHVVEWLTLLGF